LKPAQTNISTSPYLEKPFTHKKSGAEAGGTEFKPQSRKKKKKKKKIKR
jgi:hypothetical protein